MIQTAAQGSTLSHTYPHGPASRVPPDHDDRRPPIDLLERLEHGQGAPAHQDAAEGKGKLL